MSRLLAVLSTAFLLSAADVRGEAADPLSHPVRLTSHPGQDYMPAVSPGGGLLVFVSDRDGAPNLWVKTFSTAEIPTPRRLTDGAAAEKNPSFSPDGKRLVYTTYDADAEGDIALMTLPSIERMADGVAGPVIRLTGADTADREPVFSHNGQAIIYVSSRKPAGGQGLWRYDLQSGETIRLTADGATPSLAPDDRRIVYTRRPSPGVSEVWLLNQDEGSPTRLTPGPLDTWPTFVAPDKIVFVRYHVDTNGDGRLSVDDHPALYLIDLARPDIDPVPLTPHDRQALFPADGGARGIVYTEAGAGVDLFLLDPEGMAPVGRNRAASVAQAERIDRYYPDNIPYRALGWRVAGAAHAADDRPDLAARAGYETALLDEATGDPVLAKRELRRMIEAYPDEASWNGYAAIALARLSAVSPADVAATLPAVAKTFSDRRVTARGMIETGKALTQAGRPDEGAALLGSVMSDNADLPNLAVEAGVTRDAALAFTGRSDTRIDALADILRRFPSVPHWSAEAERLMVDLAEGEPGSDEAERRLSTMAERYPDLGQVAGGALNRLALRFYEAGRFLQARQSWQETVERFPDQPRVVDAALFGIAESYVAEEKYADALGVYRRLLPTTAGRAASLKAARAGYIRQGLAKADYEKSHGEPTLALKTYREIAAYAPTTVEAHRGVVQSLVGMGETEKAIDEYEALVRQHPRDPVVRYALGLALTYRTPPPFDRAATLIREGVALEERSPWMSQTLGWIYEQKGDGDPVWFERALQEYHFALALLPDDAPVARAADLWMNVGNVSYRLGDCGGADEAWRRRDASPHPFVDRKVEALFWRRWGECGYRLGDDKSAVARFDRGLALSEGDDGASLELWERKGLAQQSAGSYDEAARSYEEGLALRRTLFPKESHTPALRNIANNRYLAAERFRKGTGQRREAMRVSLRWFLEAETSLADYRPVVGKEEGGGFFNVTLRAGAAAPKVGKGFSVDDERKLIYHHLARIYEELGRLDLAAGYYEKKMALIPALLSLVENGPVLTEKGITANQLGVMLARSGKIDEGARWIATSMRVCLDLLNGPCLAANIDALGMMAMMAKGRPAWLDDGIALSVAGAPVMTKALADDPQALAKVYLRMGELAQRRLTLSLATVEGKDPVAEAKRWRMAGSDLAAADRWYGEAIRLLADIGGPDAPRMRLAAKLNRADLAEIAGEGEEATTLRRQVVEEGTALGLDEPVWRALALMALVADEPDALVDQAVERLMAAPFGTVGGDRLEADLALTRFLFRQRMNRWLDAGEKDKTLLEAEREALTEAKLSLAPLVMAGTTPDMVRFGDLVEYWRAGVALGAGTGGDEERSVAGEEYRAFVDELATRDPFLAQIADPRRFDEGALGAALRRDEQAIREVTGADGEVVRLSVGRDDAPNLILLTPRPFTDPVGDRPADRVTTLSPGLAFLAAARRIATPDDYRLFVAGPVEKERIALLGFGEINAASGPDGERLLTDPALGAGVVWFTLPPHEGRAPLDLTFPLAGEGEPATSLTVAELVGAGRGGAAMVTGKVNETGSEAALVAATILAGYPSWVIDATAEETLATSVLATARDTSVGESVAIARMEGDPAAGRLVGVVGFTAEERRAWAGENFTLRARQGMDAAAKEAYAEAATLLADARRFAAEARIDRYDDTILSSLAEVRFRGGDLAGSLSAQQEVTDLRAAKGETAGVVRSLALAGQILSKLGRHDEAIEALSTAVDLARVAGSIDEVADALSQLGLAQENGARYDPALGSFTEAASLAGRRGKSGAEAQALTRIGRLALLRTNDYDRAAKAYDQAIALYEKAGNAEGALAARLDRGLVEADRGDLSMARTIYEQGLADAVSSGFASLQGEALLRLADIAWYAADYQASRDKALAAMRLYKGKGDEGGRARSANTLGLVGWSVNDYAAADRWLKRSLALAREASAPLDEASAHNNLGLVARSRGELDEALDQFRRAEAIDRRIGSQWGEAYAARNLSITYLMMGNRENALAEADRAVTLTATIGDRVNGAKAVLQKAVVLQEMGRSEDALILFREAVERSRAVGLPEVTWRALRGLGKLNGDVDLYRQGVAVVESMRASLKGEEMTGGFLENKQDLYEELVLLLLDEGREEEAFAYAERARGRAFVDQLGGVRLKLKDETSRALADRVAALRRQIATLTRSGGAENVGVKKAEAALAETIARIERDRPDLLPLVAVPRFDAASILGRIKPDTALIEYLSTPHELVIFVLADGAVTAKRIPVAREALSTAVADLRERIETGAPVGDLPTTLGGWLIDPVASRLAGRPLWAIAPHGPLHYLPFAVVASDGAPLLERAVLFMTPTASALSEGEGADRLLASGLALGNPDIGDDRFSLPMAALEAASVGWSFVSADVATGGDATETLLRRAAANYRAVHVASHGVYDPAAPMASALMLAPDADNDGKLTAAEVFSLPLRADLVTLSACQTGVGKVSRGEEVTGLTRAFLYAGATSVVSTLWRVDDMASALLVKHFYRNLATMHKAAALREAQRLVRLRFPHPAYWGAFVLTGDPR